MSFILTIQTERWLEHQTLVKQAVRDAGAELVPVAKGNGYGLGNLRLAQQAVNMSCSVLAVGTVHEALALLAAGPEIDILVLEPLSLGGVVTAAAWRELLAHPSAGRVVLTLASRKAAEDLAGAAQKWVTPNPVRFVLEGLTSMRRFGMPEGEIERAIGFLESGMHFGAFKLEGLALHLPIAPPAPPRIGQSSALESNSGTVGPVTSGSARVREVVAWGRIWPQLLEQRKGVPDAGAIWVSHLSDLEINDVCEALPDFPIKIRMGTRLWLGSRGCLKAQGEVLAVHRTLESESAGYHQRRSPRGGHVVVVSGGTSHGVALTAPRPALSVHQRAAAAGSGALEAAGKVRSPFKLPSGANAWFLEPPHMHVSMLRIPRDVIPPPVGEFLECDVRFTTVQPDTVTG